MKNIMSDYSHCRLCAELTPKSDLLEVCNNETDNLNLEYKILHCFQVQIELDDKLPKCVCSKCCEQVNVTYEFSEKVQKAQETLWSIVNQLDSKDTLKLEFLKTEYADSVENGNPTLENKPTLDPTDLAECVFENNHYDDDVKHESDTSDVENVSLFKRKLRKRKTSKNPPVRTKKQRAVKSKFRKEESVKEVQKSKEEIQKGVRLRKILEEWKNYKWNCVKCENQLTSAKELREHYTNVHETAPLYKCMECPKVHEKYDLFKKHVRAHRNKHKFQCDICGKYSYKRAHHDRHIEIHSKIRKYMCSMCGKSFKTQGSLYSHSRMHLPAELKNRYECDICHKYFSSAPNLSSHKKIHTGIKEYTCEQCGKNFTQKVNLDQHIKSKHTDETPFHCTLCPRAFKTIYRLKSHQTLHTNIRPFKCETCGKAFREKGMMKAHSKIHSTEFPFECEYCKKCFKLKAFLRIHLRQHTGERPYSCQDCNHHFTNWSNYSKHMKGRHGINVKSATTQLLQQQRLQLMQQELLQQNENDIKIHIPLQQSTYSSE